MALFPNLDDGCICALATPPGRSGIAVIRMSGKTALQIVRAMAPTLAPEPRSHQLYLVKLRDPGSSEILDEVLLSYFAEGRSYTGEEAIELSCHGNPVIVQRILRCLVDQGARIAGPGEFTYRAFMNSKLDLVQAESVLSLIEAQSERAGQLAMRQLDGGLSKILLELEDQLTFVMANFEASIDFTEEDIEIIDYSKAELAVAQSLEKVRGLLNSYRKGRAIREGIHVALVGLPNAGKSSILNALVQEDKAIVSDIAGTTRDVVEGHIQRGGLGIHLFDTAGLRQTSDSLEALGIQKSLQTLKKADLALWIVSLDSQLTTQLTSLDSQSRESLMTKELCIVLSKADLIANDPHKMSQAIEEVKNIHKELTGKDIAPDRVISCSTLRAAGMLAVEGLLLEYAESLQVQDSGVLQQARHFELLGQAEVSLVKAVELIAARESAEFVSFELHECIFRVHELLGKRFDDEVMDRVFKEFCIGK